MITKLVLHKIHEKVLQLEENKKQVHEVRGEKD